MQRRDFFEGGCPPYPPYRGWLSKKIPPLHAGGYKKKKLWIGWIGWSWIGWLSRFKLNAFGVLVWRRCLGMGTDGWAEGWADGRGRRERAEREGAGKGVVYDYEAYEAKKKRGRNCAVFCFAGKKKNIIILFMM